MSRPIVKNSTDQSTVIRIIDSTDGSPETGVVYNTSGIDLWYRREGAAKVSITEATLSALTDAHSDGGILHIGDGYYRLDLPDAAVATGVDGVAVGGTVTGMVVMGTYHPLVTQVSLSSSGFVTLADASLTAAKFGTAAITATAVADGAVTATKFGTGAITNTAVADGAMSAAKFATGAITSSVVADGFLTAAKFASGAITSTVVADGFLTSAKVATTLPASLDSTQTAAVADKLIGRNVAGGTDGGRTVKQALSVLRNKVAIDTVNNLLVVYDTDDTTPVFTASITTAVRNPLTAVDPT